MLRRLFSKRSKDDDDQVIGADNERAPDGTPDDVLPPGPPIGFDGHPLPHHKDVPTGSDGKTIYGPGIGC